jgi:hypothetical protein
MPLYRAALPAHLDGYTETYQYLLVSCVEGFEGGGVGG